MRSWDLWGTLVAGRDPAIRDGDQDGHFPIAENVAKVRPGDLIISDYHTPDKACHVLKHVARLDNDIIVTPDGKATGEVWKRLQACGQTPELHTGDDAITDYHAPRAQGIRAEFHKFTELSPLETDMTCRGFPGIARLMREARLASWHDDKTMRDLQLFQTQVNLPFLFFASILLHRRMIHSGAKRLLMSSRDCWLWWNIYCAICLRYEWDTDYLVNYFWTSRLTRLFPSDNYERYCSAMFEVPSLVVDLCGFGTSLAQLVGDRAKTLLLVGYKGCTIPHLVPGWMNEVTNFARHPMVADVDESSHPIYTNPLDIDWEAVPELAVMHEAFLRGTNAVRDHNFEADFACEDTQADKAMRSIFGHFDDYSEALSTLTDFRVREAHATADLLNARGGKEVVV